MQIWFVYIRLQIWCRYKCTETPTADMLCRSTKESTWSQVLNSCSTQTKTNFHPRCVFLFLKETVLRLLGSSVVDQIMADYLGHQCKIPKGDSSHSLLTHSDKQSLNPPPKWGGLLHASLLMRRLHEAVIGEPTFQICIFALHSKVSLST